MNWSMFVTGIFVALGCIWIDALAVNWLLNIYLTEVGIPVIAESFQLCILGIVVIRIAKKASFESNDKDHNWVGLFSCAFMELGYTLTMFGSGYVFYVIYF